MKCWVVGMGLLGKEVVKAFESEEVVKSNRKECDLVDFAQVEKFFCLHQPNIVVNCTGYVDVNRAEIEKDKAYSVNVEGVKNLAELSLANKAKLIHVSTDYVFDGIKGGYLETDKTNPVNFYGTTKALGEKILMQISSEFLSVRTSSLYGPSKSNLISRMVDNLKRSEKIISPVDQKSTPTSTIDLAKAIYGARNCKGILHFTNGGGATRYEVISFVKRNLLARGIFVQAELVAGYQSDVNKVKRPANSVLNIQKIEKILPWKIRAWENALKEYLERTNE